MSVFVYELLNVLMAADSFHFSAIISRLWNLFVEEKNQQHMSFSIIVGLSLSLSLVGLITPVELFIVPLHSANAIVPSYVWTCYALSLSLSICMCVFYHILV